MDWEQKSLGMSGEKERETRTGKNCMRTEELGKYKQKFTLESETFSKEDRKKGREERGLEGKEGNREERVADVLRV